jgi:hypothetical protein
LRAPRRIQSLPDADRIKTLSLIGDAAMAVNLVSLVMQFLTPNMIGRIASALGLDRDTVQAAVSSAVPSLLAGFSNVAAQPGGAQKLVDAATQQTGTLDSFARVLGAGNHSSLIESGSQLLSSLLGSRAQNGLTEAIGKFAGMGQASTASLLGMLAPVVLGSIAQHQGAKALDPGRITALLAGQKDNIAAAMPAQMENLLAGTGLLDSLGGAARTAMAAGSEAARTSASAARSVGDATLRTARAAAYPLNWLYWLIPAAAIAGLLLYLLARTPEQVAQEGGTVGLAPSTTVGGLDVNKQVADSLAGLRTTLDGVSDSASAQAALPKLRDVAAQIDKVTNLRGQLSAEQRRILAASVDPAMPALNQLFDKVLAVPGVSDDLKPTVDALKTKLAALSS